MEKLSQELLRYGEVINDVKYENWDYVRIRKILFHDELYLHIMINGNVVTIEKVQA